MQSDFWAPSTEYNIIVIIFFITNLEMYISSFIFFFFFFQMIEPKLTSKPVNWKRVNYFKEEVSKTVEHLEKAFLHDGPYLCNQPVISICDILGACELMQLNAVHEEQLYESNPIIHDWMKRVKKDLAPHFDEAHKIVYRAREVYEKMKSYL